jgi:phosphatidylglycerol:prolipoprotein diacylglycerol transferase
LSRETATRSRTGNEFMHPWLLTSPPISTYGTCIVLALIATWIWLRGRAARAAIEPSRIDLLMPHLAGTGLAGAWLFGKLADRAVGTDDHAAVLVGSLLLATAAGIGFGIASRIPLGILGDLCSAPLALGIAIGRLGCFFAGCCFGKVCDHPTALTAVRYPAGSFAWLEQQHAGLLPPDFAGRSLPVYPVQMYESAGCLLLALAIASLRWPRIAGKAVAGERFLAVGIGYALLRFFAENLRGDNPPIHGLTFSQWTSLGILLLAGSTWFLRRHFAKLWHLPPYEQYSFALTNTPAPM